MKVFGYKLRVVFDPYFWMIGVQMMDPAWNEFAVYISPVPCVIIQIERERHAASYES